ncbi:MAG: hypothetical protein ABJL99_02580 [Aliishimia sp.]
MGKGLSDFEGLNGLFDAEGSFSLPTGQVVLRDCLMMIDGKENSNGKLVFWYDRHGDSHFEWSTEENGSPKILRAFTKQVSKFSVKMHDSREPIEMLSVQTTVSHDGTTLKRFTSTRSPIIAECSESAASIELILLNGPEFSNFNRPILLETPDIKIKIEEVSGTHEKRKRKSDLRKDSIPTARIEIVTSIPGNLKNSRFTETIFQLSDFLTLIRGGACGVGHGLAEDADGKPAFYFLDFTRNDQFHLEQNWYCRSVSENIQELFSKFLITSRSDVDGQVFRRAISYYRAANVTAISNRESGLITGFAALELLSTHILKTRGGWTESLLSQRTSASDKMAASCALLGLTVDPFGHAGELTKLAKSNNKLSAFELLAKFRNHLVHQSKEFVFEGIHLRQVWELNQWLVELHLLFLLGYYGKMTDRRKLRGWAGETVDVPLSRRD